jgi:hypothetical protein
MKPDLASQGGFKQSAGITHPGILFVPCAKDAIEIDICNVK